MYDDFSPELYGEIIRSFGSVADMQRAFDSALARSIGTVYLIATPDARLHIVCCGDLPVGTVLRRSGEPLDVVVLSERYAAIIANRPRYPHP